MIEDLREQIIEVRKAMKETDSRLEFRKLSEKERILTNALEDAIYDLPISVSVSYSRIWSVEELDTMCIADEYIVTGDINKAVLSVVEDFDDVNMSQFKVEIL